MATCTVRFDFFCGETKTLTYGHKIPSSLITNPTITGKDARYNELFRKTAEPIVKKHEGLVKCAAGQKELSDVDHAEL
ncbi:hypothetical protein QQX98_009047 [Neonectria punicea]|uniref:Uncharacterized protein n=1 Tax=Neonectria punicea TaxID=979145 RepID=A0ABR1GTU3_9HYPO